MDGYLQCDGTSDNSPVEYCAGVMNSETPVTMSPFRPRGSLARALYEKQKADEYLSALDKKQWYHCNLKNMAPSISSRFIQLEVDEETTKFIEQSEEKSDSILLQIWHSVAKAFLSWFMTQTSINGWLRRGSMFVLSFGQFVKLLGRESDMLEESLLDLGAGDGEVTVHLARAYETVYVTEVSSTMQALLRNRGYHILPVDNWQEPRKYHTIACLNLLDRCDSPRQILKDIHNSLKPNGRAIVALVLPFSPYVETGSKNHQPKELLPIEGITFEDQVESAITELFEKIGFEVEAWTRVPYLCEGDLNQSYYWLDDAVFVLKIN